jgi:CheY-like chemotaxis protein
MTRILHVEADSTLATAVEEAFEAFGFRGSYVIATTVAEARRMLESLPSSAEPDLIICDMHLPDGTGLDIVRDVRSNPALSHVPIMIVSDDVDRSIVNRAYALGANSYVDTSARGRSIADTIKSLYTYWLKNARLPALVGMTRTSRYAAKAASIGTRLAAAYMQIAGNLGLPDGKIWMDLALQDGNIANILTFLTSQLRGREIPEDVLAAAEAAQRVHAEDLETLERRGVRARDEADRYMLGMLSNLRAETVARALSHLFPIAPVAMSALCESWATGLEHLASWIETHSSNLELRRQVVPLREDAAQIRSSSSSTVNHSGTRS